MQRLRTKQLKLQSVCDVSYIAIDNYSNLDNALLASLAIALHSHGLYAGLHTVLPACFGHRRAFFPFGLNPINTPGIDRAEINSTCTIIL